MLKGLVNYLLPSGGEYSCQHNSKIAYVCLSNKCKIDGNQKARFICSKEECKNLHEGHHIIKYQEFKSYENILKEEI